ncbi:hypothetical protein Bca52824_042556 [Brassica carinata]|uniref:Uncharacterized protein n=1 Tax=Brassica carinata TaxID=52824 RepID=A0A8X7RXN9_BRACI|nr:hypothetical protein Bca52824_042556 [Brassica carinata]
MATPSPPPPRRPQQQPPPMRKTAGMPSSFRPKPKRRSCCRTCCCCLCITLVLLLVLLLVATAVFYLWFDPKLPTFSLASFRLDGFKLSDDPDGASLRHRRGAWDEESQRQTRFLLREHRRGDERRQRKRRDGDGRRRSTGSDKSKDLVINVVAKTKVGLGVGGMKIGMLAVNLRCGGVSLNKLDTDSPKCTLNTLKCSLTVTTAPALLDVLMAADKFEVASCMRYCSRLLRNMPMTPDSALLYLDLPSSVLMAEAVQPLTDAAKQFLASRYKDITKGSYGLTVGWNRGDTIGGDLQIASEDAVYDFVLKWARDSTVHWKTVSDSWFTPCALHPLPIHDAENSKAAEGSDSTNRRFIERAYKYRPVKVVEFEPRPQCVVYLDLKREECQGCFLRESLFSGFSFGRSRLLPLAHCNMDQQSSFYCFGLFLGMQEKGAVSFGVDYEFAARQKPSQDYSSKYKGTYTFTGGKAVGYRNLFAIPWTSFIAEDSQYFINGVLHLRAELTISRP